MMHFSLIEQTHGTAHLDKWVDFHMLWRDEDSISPNLLSESLRLAAGFGSKSIFVILTWLDDNNGKHPKPNLLSPILAKV